MSDGLYQRVSPEQALAVECPLCGEPAGEYCRQPSGKRATSGLHTARFRAADGARGWIPPDEAASPRAENECGERSESMPTIACRLDSGHDGAHVFEDDEVRISWQPHDYAALQARIRDLEGALREICDSWDNPPPAARMDVRYQDAVRLARAALEADRPADE